MMNRVNIENVNLQANRMDNNMFSANNSSRGFKPKMKVLHPRSASSREGLSAQGPGSRNSSKRAHAKVSTSNIGMDLPPN